ncbi:hypothetical protein JJJ17_00135 [Paracoccus caeni]|uniref:Type III secretion protein L n=1 Tax=Paracoccus caeni TaxID=657651 RepID=A0A934VWU7_9RHOB|nr:hypothetical protein [Paracoccus caeni]MBK4214322.1 hypothetical protein [Paracoccus caeni]
MARAKQIQSSRILRKKDLAKLRDAERILREAEEASEASKQAAMALEQEILDAAHKRALREAARAASRVIADAEAATSNRMQNMETELAQLVSQTVRAILGSYATEEATYRAALNALSQMREHRQGRIFAAQDVVDLMRRAVTDLGDDGAEVTQILTDTGLAPGQAFLVSDRGSAEIGLSALTDSALRIWDAPKAGKDRSE